MSKKSIGLREHERIMEEAQDYKDEYDDAYLNNSSAHRKYDVESETADRIRKGKEAWHQRRGGEMSDEDLNDPPELGERYHEIEDTKTVLGKSVIRAHVHFQENQDHYEQAAIDDANSRGIEINTGMPGDIITTGIPSIMHEKAALDLYDKK